MTWLKRKLQDWLGITALANKVVNLELGEDPEVTQEELEDEITKGYQS